MLSPHRLCGRLPARPAEPLEFALPRDFVLHGAVELLRHAEEGVNIVTTAPGLGKGENKLFTSGICVGA